MLRFSQQKFSVCKLWAMDIYTNRRENVFKLQSRSIEKLSMSQFAMENFHVPCQLCLGIVNEFSAFIKTNVVCGRERLCVVCVVCCPSQ